MDLDALLHHYFDSLDPDPIDPTQLGMGKEKLAVDFGIERDPARRFALWTLMEAFGIAPSPADAFKDHRLKHAAENYLNSHLAPRTRLTGRHS
jgi:hypothetical protein